MKDVFNSMLFLLVACVITFILALLLGFETARSSIEDDCRLQKQFRVGERVYTCERVTTR